MLFVFCLSIDVVLRIVSGMLTPQLMIYSVSSLWCVLLGLLVGQKLFKRMNADTFAQNYLRFDGNECGYYVHKISIVQ